jgi:hypothetical protein
MRLVFLSLILISMLSSFKQNNASPQGATTDTATAKKEVAQAEEAMFNAIKNNDPRF